MQAPQKFTQLFLLIGFLALWPSGCATVPHPPIAEGRFIQIDGAQYLPLSAVAKLHGLELIWDPDTRRAELSSETLKVRLRPGSPVLLINGRTEILEEPVLFHEGMIVVPSSFTRRLSPYLAEVRRPSFVRPRYRIQRVIVDAGHGGYDPGAIGRRGLREKTVALDIAKRLKSELEAQGIDVVMTRKDDTFISLHRRTYLANQADADFFVSVHCNASRSRGVNGFEVYHLRPTAETVSQTAGDIDDTLLEEEAVYHPDSTNLRAVLWDMVHAEDRVESVELARTVAWAMNDRLPTPNRGVKGARFYVLNGVRMPAVLVEVGFISNVAEEERLRSRDYRQQIAEAIAAGILAYKAQYERTDGFTN